MKSFKIALLHCPKSSVYKLMRFTKEMDESDPCIMWVFDSSKLTLAKKIMKNMNIARSLNPATGFPALG